MSFSCLNKRRKSSSAELTSNHILTVFSFLENEISARESQMLSAVICIFFGTILLSLVINVEGRQSVQSIRPVALIRCMLSVTPPHSMQVISFDMARMAARTALCIVPTFVTLTHARNPRPCGGVCTAKFLDLRRRTKASCRYLGSEGRCGIGYSSSFFVFLSFYKTFSA